MLRRTSVAALAGAVLALAFFPTSWWYVVPVCVAAYVLCVRGLSVVRAVVPALAFGLAFQLVLIFWMRVIGWDAWIALSVLEALFYAGLGPVTALVTRLPCWPVWSACAWVGCEWLRSNGVTAWMPWGRISYAMIDTPVAPAFSWVGGNGVSLLLALLGTLLAWAVLHVRARPRAAVGLVGVGLALVLVPGLSAYTPGRDGSLTVAVVQGGVPGDGSDILFDYRQVTRNHVDLTERLASDVAAGRTPAPAFVVWPENSTAVDPFTDAETHDDILEASHAVGVPILVGGMVDSPKRDQVLNQGIVWDPVTGAGDRYTKHHPVPMGEYVPYRSALLTKFISQLALVPRDMAAGTRTQPLRIAGTLVADAICFDVGFDDAIDDQVRRGAQLVVVQTSNASFIHSHQLDQQFDFTRLRAIETGRAVVVASTNGISAIIRPDGSVERIAPRKVGAVLVGDVSLARGVTPGVVLGPWIGRISVGVALAAAVVALGVGFGYRRGRSDRRPPSREAAPAPSPTAPPPTGQNAEVLT